MTSHFAVMTLTSGYSPSLGSMALSQASDATLESVTHYHEGYPLYEPGCDWNNDAPIIGTYYYGINPLTGLLYQYEYFGSWQYTAYGPVQEVRTDSVRFEVSSASGMSGAPFYYCPAGCTETSGTGYVTALTTGHVWDGTADSYSLGPKARNVRDWVVAHL